MYTSSLSRTIRGLFELTRCFASWITENQGHQLLCPARRRSSMTLSRTTFANFDCPLVEDALFASFQKLESPAPKCPPPPHSDHPPDSKNVKPGILKQDINIFVGNLYEECAVFICTIVAYFSKLIPTFTIV